MAKTMLHGAASFFCNVEFQLFKNMVAAEQRPPNYYNYHD